MRKAYNLEFKMYADGDNKIKSENGNYKIHTNNVEYKFHSYWLAYTNGYHFNDEDVRNMGLGDTLKLDASKIKDKKFYRYPDLNLPRQKVDLLKDKYNIKVVRNLDKADYKIISKKFLSKIITCSWDTHYNKSVVYGFLKQLKDEDLISACGLNFFRLLLQETEADAMFAIKTPYYYSSIPAQKEKFVEQFKDVANKHFTDKQSRSLLLGVCNSEARKNDVEIFTSMVSNQNELVLDETVIDIIDEGLAVIDNTQYEDMEKMITSGNIDDRFLAVEMLANCNVSKSFDVVSGLYYWHYDWFKNTNNWNTVNVKTLRSQMKTYEGGHSTSGIWSFNNYIEKLASDGKLTKFAVDRTRKALLEKHLASDVGPSAEVFKVDLENLVICDKFKDQIIDD